MGFDDVWMYVGEWVHTHPYGCLCVYGVYVSGCMDVCDVGCMYVYVYVCTCVWACMYVCMYVCMCIYVCICVCMCVCGYVGMGMYMCICVYARRPQILSMGLRFNDAALDDMRNGYPWLA